MRIIFAGTPEFAVPCLQALINSEHEVVAVYSQPDRPAGRGLKLTLSPIKQLALTYQLPIYQPITLRDTLEQQRLTVLQADLMVVVAYGLILPKSVLSIPTFGCINVHASLLPRWRGAAPIQRAILAGDTVTGITLMQMDEGLDTGPMLEHVTCPISPTDTSLTLQQKLAQLGSETLLKVLKNLEHGLLHPQAQNNTQACYAKKIEKQEAQINWELSANELGHQVHAFNPWPISYTYLAGQIIKIWQAQPLTENSHKTPGTIVKSSKDGIDVATGEGTLRILQLQLPGGRCLNVADVLNAKADWFIAGVKLGL